MTSLNEGLTSSGGLTSWSTTCSIFSPVSYCSHNSCSWRSTSEAEQRLQALCDQYELGIRVEQVVLQDVNPPDEVKPSFNEVNQAQQERERMINEARTQFNRVIPKARGEAQQTIQEAEGYATDRVNRSKGDAARFESLYAAYKRSPAVTRRRIYLETLQEVLPGVQRTVVLDEDLKGLLPLLSLDKGGN